MAMFTLKANKYVALHPYYEALQAFLYLLALKRDLNHTRQAVMRITAFCNKSPEPAPSMYAHIHYVIANVASVTANTYKLLAAS